MEVPARFNGYLYPLGNSKSSKYHYTCWRAGACHVTTECGMVHKVGGWLEGFDCLALEAGVNFVITRHSGTSKGNKVNDIHAAKAKP